jgi:hypothetical protein
VLDAGDLNDACRGRAIAEVRVLVIKTDPVVSEATMVLIIPEYRP